MSWRNPLPLRLVATADSLSFKGFPDSVTGLPLPPHPGAFGVARKHHIHEGIDLYCAENTAVSAVESGEVVGLLPFTGVKVGSPWWNETDALLIEERTGVVVYGEISARDNLRIGGKIKAGEFIGQVRQVLRVDKGRPLTMLHLELHQPGTRDVYEWLPSDPRPASLLDPTPYLWELVS